MGADRLAPGIPQVGLVRAAGPTVRFILVAALAAVKQVIRVVRAAVRPRLEVVDRQLAASISLRDTAVLARETGSLAHVLAHFCRNSHAFCVVRDAASSCWSAAFSRRR